eukprot:scaffold638_cov382-Prasinococcus_capsulatus_cf.AAC.8
MEAGEAEPLEVPACRVESVALRARRHVHCHSNLAQTAVGLRCRDALGHLPLLCRYSSARAPRTATGRCADGCIGTYRRLGVSGMTLALRGEGKRPPTPA